MEVIFTKDEVKEILHLALCNGGVQELYYCDVTIDYTSKAYEDAKAELLKDPKWENETLCREDVWIQIMEMGKLYFSDGNEEKKVKISITKAIRNFRKSKYVKEPMKILDENGNDDAWTAFNTLQLALYGDIIYG